MRLLFIDTRLTNVIPNEIFKPVLQSVRRHMRAYLRANLCILKWQNFKIILRNKNLCASVKGKIFRGKLLKCYYVPHAKLSCGLITRVEWTTFMTFIFEA